ncbi:MAG: T9SS type A sorting domain-containing protein [Candidatus Zixiibacteriota bacterium]|nr:MAG: T9SS type A sorting domain-containing protein [candidate division Zixibacteria bacterium]
MNNLAKGIPIFIAAWFLINPISDPSADENSWSTNGPAGGTVYSIEIHPQNPQIVFIGTIQNGIYKTTDGGNLWNHVESHEQMSCMREIAIHPYGPDTIYATSTGGMFKSEDGGADWTKLYPPHGINNEYTAFLIHPEDPSLLFAGGPANEWKSTNSGQTWEQLGIPHLAGIEDIAVDPSNTDLMYLVTNTMRYGNGVFKSTDRGESWSNIQNNIAGQFYCWSIAIDPQNTDILYLGLSNFYLSDTDSCLFKSTNAGQSWFDITPGGLYIGEIFDVAVSPFESNTVFACSFSDGLFKSTDGGVSWNRSNEGLRTFQLSKMEFDIPNGIIYLGTLDGIYKSTDNGANWLKISHNINLSYSQGFTVSSTNPSSAFVATPGGLYKTTDMGQSWSFVDVGFPDEHGIGGILYDRIDTANVYLSTAHQWWDNQIYETGFYRSTDDGVTWHFFNAGLPWDNYYFDMDMSYMGPEDKRIFLSSHRGVYYSDDTGETWNICSNGIPQNIYFEAIDVAPSNQNVVAAGTDGLINNIYLSLNRGQDWQLLNNYPSTNGYYIIDIEFNPLDEEHIYASSWGGGLFESPDQGQTWFDITNDMPVNPDYPSISGIAINPHNQSNIFVSSGRYGIYQSHNGGQNWEPFNEGLDTTASSGFIEFAAGDTNKIYFASGGRSVWTITRTPTGIAYNESSLPTNVTLQNYPNPFNSSTTIEFALPEAGEVSLTVYDILGRKIGEPINEFKPAGYHDINIDMSEFPSGLYFYVLTNAEITISKKMVYLK